MEESTPPLNDTAIFASEISLKLQALNNLSLISSCIFLMFGEMLGVLLKPIHHLCFSILKFF